MLRFEIRGEEMARGVMPRRPAKSGRHESAIERQGRVQTSSPASIKKSYSPSKTPKSIRKSIAKTAKNEAAAVAKTKGYSPVAPERVSEIRKRLDQLYPDVTCALSHRTPWELLVATILSAQSTDVRVNLVTPELFRKYPTVEDFALLEAQDLEPDVRSTGFFRNKSKSLVGAARRIVTDFGGKVPDNMADLLTLPGVARKTANVVLGTWFGKADGVVVDTHVHRISRRLELTKNNDPKKIEEDLMRVVPREKWILFPHQLI